jgi:hypothetical protein
MKVSFHVYFSTVLKGLNISVKINLLEYDLVHKLLKLKVLNTEDGDSRFLRKVDCSLPDHTMSENRNLNIHVCDKLISRLFPLQRELGNL